MKDANLNSYNSKSILKWYKNSHAFETSEQLFFDTNKEFILKANVLDIGIGAGRTTSYLIGKCKTYTGIDYAKGFVDTVKEKYPQADIRMMDARDLSTFRDNSFDYVNFSFNGIDYVDLDGRKKILSEINRVLKPGGIFFFSTHNKNHENFYKKPWLNSQQSFIINLKTFIKLLPFTFRHYQQKRKELLLKDYAIINDSAHNYSLLTFYTTALFLKHQLSENKFTDIILFSKDPELFEEKLDAWFYVSCKKLFT